MTNKSKNLRNDKVHGKVNLNDLEAFKSLQNIFREVFRNLSFE